MKPAIESVWISPGLQVTISPEEAADCNTDVIVTLSTGERYAATFFTYQNIATLTNKNRLTGEWLGGQYFWATDMILIDKIDPVLIRQVIDDLISDDCWPAAFARISPAATDTGN